MTHESFAHYLRATGSPFGKFLNTPALQYADYDEVLFKIRMEINRLYLEYSGDARGYIPTDEGEWI